MNDKKLNQSPHNHTASWTDSNPRRPADQDQASSLDLTPDEIRVLGVAAGRTSS